MRMRKAMFGVALAVFATGAVGKSAEMKRYVHKPVDARPSVSAWCSHRPPRGDELVV